MEATCGHAVRKGGIVWGQLQSYPHPAYGWGVGGGDCLGGLLRRRSSQVPYGAKKRVMGRKGLLGGWKPLGRQEWGGLGAAVRFECS